MYRQCTVTKGYGTKNVKGWTDRKTVVEGTEVMHSCRLLQTRSTVETGKARSQALDTAAICCFCLLTFHLH